MEIWRDIKDYEGLYQISNLGRIKSLPRIKRNFNINSKQLEEIVLPEKIRKPQLTQYGYYRIGLTKNHKQIYYSVHRLVAEAFIPNPNNLPQVNHINGIKTDNRVENLEWCDNSFNQKHAFNAGLQKGNSDHPNSKLTYDDVIYIKTNYKKGVLGKGIRSLAAKFNVCCATIQQIIDGKSYKNIK